MSAISCSPNQIVTPVGTWTVYITNAVLVLLYVATMTRVAYKAKSSLVLLLIVLLVCVDISTAVWCYSNHLKQSQACDYVDYPNLFSLSRYNRGIIGMGISGFLSEALFALVHWMFAYKYWILSYKIEMIVEGGPEKKLSC